MDTTFVFPKPQAPIPRPQKQEPEPQSRDSNVTLRASVLDAALELGIGSNSTVTKWMFDNAVVEEDEEPQASPGLTSGSTATSDSSHASGDHIIYSTAPSQPINYYTNPAFFAGPPMGASIPTHSSDSDNPMLSSASSTNTITVAGPHSEPVHEQTNPFSLGRNKLKKKRGGDGYESDGGYVSDSARKRKEKERKKKEGSQEAAMEKARKEQEKEDKKRLKAELKAAERMRKKSATARDAPSLDDLHQAGYETDATTPRKAKSKKSSKKTVAGDGYETDDGYISSSGKKKKSFFKRSKKNDPPPDLPPSNSHNPVPPIPLPVAGRFATTLPDLTTVSSRSGESSLDFLPPPRMPAASETSRSDTPDSNPQSFFEDDDDDEITSPSTTSHPLRNFLTRQRSSDDSHPSSDQSGAANTPSPFGFGRAANTRDIPASLPLQREDIPPHEQQSSPDGSSYVFGIAIGTPSPSHQAELNIPFSTNRSTPSPISLGRVSPRPQPSLSPRDIVDQHSHPPSARHSGLSVIPSADYIVPSPQLSPSLPSPNRVFHDQPPPTPPPSSPLPLPPSGMAPPVESMPRRPSNDNLDAQPQQRGRTSPFPTRPSHSASPLGGLEARAKVARYRDLYTLPPAQWNTAHPHSIARPKTAEVRQWSNDIDQRSVGIDVEAPSDDEADVEELRDALIGRFASDDEADPYVEGVALDRSQSLTLRDSRNRSPSPGGRAPSPRVRFADTQSPTPRESHFTGDFVGMYRNSRDADRSRDSRWTESVYSRQSFVGDETSADYHQHLVTQAEELYDENGREVEAPTPYTARYRRPIEKF